MKLPTHPAIDFIRAYWVQILVALLFVSMAIANVVISMENRVLKATLKNAATTISNYETAAKDNLQTISTLEAANLAWANAANANDVIVSEQIAALDAKQAALAKKEESLQRELEKAHAQNKQYSDAVVPPAVSRRLRENSRSD
jgi:uncharacterized protein with PhoU and TrkA domain